MTKKCTHAISIPILKIQADNFNKSVKFNFTPKEKIYPLIKILF